jgi:hypothetical protein
VGVQQRMPDDPMLTPPKKRKPVRTIIRNSKLTWPGLAKAVVPLLLVELPPKAASTLNYAFVGGLIPPKFEHFLLTCLQE